MYDCYSQYLGKHLVSIEKLNQTFRASCQAAITKTIQDIKEGKRSPLQPVENNHGEEGGAIVLSSFPINDALTVFQMYEQNQMALLEGVRKENQQIKEENESLNERKLALKNFEPRFLLIVQKGINPFSMTVFRSNIKSLDWRCKHETKEYPKYLSEVNSTSIAAGLFKKKMELTEKISKAVSEMEALIQEIEKGRR